MIHRVKKVALLLIGAIAVGAPTGPAPNWNTVASITPQNGVLRGNPAAPVKLIEFSSYTCPHCARFEVESDAALRLGFIGTGKGSVEIRSYFRNFLDVPVTLLARCGTPAKFAGNHAALLRSQARWAAKAEHPSQAQIQRWSNPDFAARMRAITGDLGLYPIMEARGFTRVQLDRCLANKPLAEAIANQDGEDDKAFDIKGTPSFVVNGAIQQDVWDWATLRPILEKLTR